MLMKASFISLLLVALFYSTIAVPTQGSCPDGSYPVNCLINPCQYATCPAVEGATCVADYCGGCNARWLLNGQEGTRQCKGCPDGSLPVNNYCKANPCQIASCPAVKGATCVADYCGGCNARWYIKNREVTHICEAASLPVARSVVDESEAGCSIPGQVYTECGSACPPTCDNPHPICTLHCVPGCQCPRGTVLLGGRCVLPKNCKGYPMKGSSNRPIQDLSDNHLRSSRLL